MIETLFTPLLLQDGASTLALLRGGGGYGPWGTIIGILRGLLIGAGGLGFVAGLGIKAVAMGNADRQELGNRVIERALVGLMIGLLADPIYNLIVQWTS